LAESLADILGIPQSDTKAFVDLTFDFARAANGGTLTPEQHLKIKTMIEGKMASGDITSKLVEDTVKTLLSGQRALMVDGEDFMARNATNILPSSNLSSGLN
jgi:hypothetical protein